MNIVALFFAGAGINWYLSMTTADQLDLLPDVVSQ